MIKSWQICVRITLHPFHFAWTICSLPKDFEISLFSETAFPELSGTSTPSPHPPGVILSCIYLICCNSTYSNTSFLFFGSMIYAQWNAQAELKHAVPQVVTNENTPVTHISIKTLNISSPPHKVPLHFFPLNPTTTSGNSFPISVTLGKSCLF